MNMITTLQRILPFLLFKEAGVDVGNRTRV
jgi:hypothetical protein